MTVEAHLLDLVRNVVVAEYRPVEDSVQVVRTKQTGKDAVVAVAFDDRDGVQRRGLVGLCRHHGKTWQRSGGFMGSTRVTGPRDVWMTWGGWGPAGKSRERAVAGGWVADPTACPRGSSTPQDESWTTKSRTACSCSCGRATSTFAARGWT